MSVGSLPTRATMRSGAFIDKDFVQRICRERTRCGENTHSDNNDEESSV
jgi:hypothetical protein